MQIAASLIARLKSPKLYLYVSVLSIAVWLMDYEFFNRERDRRESVREVLECCLRYRKERDKLSDEFCAAVDELGALRDKQSNDQSTTNRTSHPRCVQT